MFLNRLRFFALLAPFFAPFWSHFGSQVRHYTPFGRPGGQNRLTKHRQKNRGKQNTFEVPFWRPNGGFWARCRPRPKQGKRGLYTLGLSRERYYLLIAPALSCSYIAIHLHRCIDVSMYRYIDVSIHRCIDVSMYRCIDISRYRYIDVSMYRCIDVSTYRRIDVSMYGCIDGSMYRCIDVSMYRYIDVSMYGCIDVSMYRCIDVSMYRYIAVWMYRCIDVSLYRYIGARYKVDTVWCKIQGGSPTRSTAGRVGGFLCCYLHAMSCYVVAPAFIFCFCSAFI